MASDDGVSYIVPGGFGEKHRRARNWTDSEMKALIYVWEEFYGALKGSKRNAKIYEKMGNRLYEITGEHRHREEIKMKITNMSFQYRKLKHTTNGVGSSDWPYYKMIERILSKPPGCGKDEPLDPHQAGPSSENPEVSVPVPGASPVHGFIPEYTGSSDEKDLIDDEELSDSSMSLHSADSRSHSFPAKRRRVPQPSPSPSLRKRKVRVLEAMLQEQRKMRRAMEETCREVRRVVQQQNLLQVQSQQLQERMMNLLEKMVWPREALPAPSPAAGLKS
ncbi:myb/SANT-like DNA-binding domain-containing protein 1 [Alosa pseudoharengus]|uniref:myb/SANT-like DNA-binding domain-containing protein 1 n=1 Tax=Alosa pseudoharengus TaxID=34774 RepID=UPI003F8A4173